MKQCPTCQEEFADKFGFCPVDGTPLTTQVAQPVVAARAADESLVTAPASSSADPASSNGFLHQDGEETVSSQPVHDRGEFHLTFLEDEGLTRRLVREVRAAAHEAELTWPEFKRDPVGFTKRTAYASGALVKKFFRQDYAVPAVVAPFLVFLLIGSTWGGIRFRCELRAIIGRPCPAGSVNPNEELELVEMINPEDEIPKEQQKPDKGTAGTESGKGGGSKPQYERPHGGGGGGREEQAPASYGKLPTAQLVPPIVTANPNPPAIKNPHLPTPVTIDVDPMLIKPDPRDIAYGDPKSTSTTPSSR